jgi:protein-S-isoprenylcysteine O-methyltransferase Ste14
MDRREFGKLKRLVAFRFLAAIVVIGAMFFIPAGTFAYWQAWLYCAIVFIPVAFFALWLLRHDPELAARRMRLGEKRSAQKKVISFSILTFFIGFLMPGLDRRFHLSAVPNWLVLVSMAVVLLGYLITVLVLRENSYASRVIEIGKGQKVVTTGPYSIVRHPMYLGMALLLLFTPTALGSFWTLIPFGAIIVSLVPRIIDEEKMLMKRLPGYRKYCGKVKYRLVPFVW